MPLTGNKGEWSEIYTLLKLLGEKEVFAGDEHLNKIEEILYPIIKILRTEHDGIFEYKIDGDLVFISGSHKELRIPVKIFRKQAKNLLNEILKASGSFSIPETEEFMNSIYCKKLKADSSDKADIKMIIHDSRTGRNPELGFSIKSMLGGKSTLLNASGATNLIFKISGIKISDEQIKKINSINSKSKIKDRIAAIEKLGGSLQFISTDKSVFGNNLVLIDSLLPNILAESLLIYFSTSFSSLLDITSLIEKKNPLNFNNENRHRFYEYKIKRLLTDSALGMLPAKVWNGTYNANGGCLIVKEDGEIICYHIYNKNEFENYLYTHTKFETPSSTKHKYGVIYSTGDESYFNLNLQIRFKE